MERFLFSSIILFFQTLLLQQVILLTDLIERSNPTGTVIFIKGVNAHSRFMANMGEGFLSGKSALKLIFMETIYKQ